MTFTLQSYCAIQKYTKCLISTSSTRFQSQNPHKQKVSYYAHFYVLVLHSSTVCNYSLCPDEKHTCPLGFTPHFKKKGCCQSHTCGKCGARYMHFPQKIINNDRKRRETKLIGTSFHFSQCLNLSVCSMTPYIR